MEQPIDLMLARVEQLYTMLTGARPARLAPEVAAIPPERDPFVYVEQQLEQLLATAAVLVPSHGPARSSQPPNADARRDLAGSDQVQAVRDCMTEERVHMETVKVDIQKLQLLNERIAQTIEALNHVRMSVVGIQHSPPPVSPWGLGQPVTPYTFGAFGMGAGYPAYGPTAYGAIPYGPTPYGAYGTAPYGTIPSTIPSYAGLQHTSHGLQHSSPVTMAQQPWMFPWASSPVGNGLSHSTWDPSWALRMQSPFFVPLS